MTATDDLAGFEAVVGQLLAATEPAGRRALGRKLAADIRADQAANHAAERGPDGSPWKPRKQARTRARRPMTFTYTAPGSPPRKVTMSSYRPEGDRYTGFDTETGAIRTFLKSRMSDVKRLDRPATSRIRTRKSKRMMMKLSRRLRMQAGPDQVTVGFPGALTRIASVHHHGLKDRVIRKPGAPEVVYPVRELLGLTAEDRERLLDIALAHLQA